MDGNLLSRKKLINKNIFWPNGLTLDLFQRRMYWIDAKLQQMEVATLDGKNRKVLKRTGFFHPFAMDNFAEQIYWTDWKSDKLNRVSKFDQKNVKSIKDGLFAPMDIKVFHKSKQPPGKNRCGADKHGCSDVCLLGNQFGVPVATCACPRGKVFVQESTKKCSGKYEPRQSKKVYTTPPSIATTQSTRKKVDGGKTDTQSKLDKAVSGGVGAGTIVAILLAIVIAVVLVGVVVWYMKRRNSGKNHVTYYKDMSTKPLEDDFDIEQDEIGDMTQIST